jgi:hypothetical protein
VLPGLPCIQASSWSDSLESERQHSWWPLALLGILAAASWFRSHSNAPAKQAVKPIEAQDGTHGNRNVGNDGNGVPSGTIAAYEIPEAKAKQERAKKRRQQITQLRKAGGAWISFGTFLAVVIYAAIARNQWQAIIDTNNLSKEQFQKDERPYVWPVIEPPEIKIGAGLTAKVYFINYGKTPALKFKSVSAILPGAFLSANKADTAMTRAKRFFESVDNMLASEPDKGQIVVMQHVPEDVRFSNAQTLSYSGFAPRDRDGARETLSADYPYAIVGKAIYFDSFGNPYWTTYCMISVKDHAGAWCDSYNEIR